MIENSMDPPPSAIYWTHPVTCICLFSALDNSLGPLATESPCIITSHGVGGNLGKSHALIK